MNITKPKHLDTNLSLPDFGKAMAQLDLTGVPPHKRPQAVRDHLARIMADTITDKTQAQELHLARLYRQTKTH